MGKGNINITYMLTGL